MAADNDQGSAGRKSTGRGFASMDEEKKRQIASKGGQSVPPEKRSFSRDHNLAAEAGRKGGENVRGEERSFSRDRALAAEAGRKGGAASRGARSPQRDYESSDDKGSDSGSYSRTPDAGHVAGRKPEH